MTRLLFVPNPHTLLWLELPGSPHEIVDAVLRGDWLPPSPYSSQAGRLNAYWQEGLVIVSSLELASATRPTAPRLSRQQAEILKCLEAGYTTAQIALRLKVLPRTVAYHIARLKEIYAAASRIELVQKARALRD